MINFLNIRIFLAFSHDVLAVALVWYFSFLLRFNFELPQNYFLLINKSLIFVLAAQILSFILFGLYRGIWRFASIIDLKRIILSIFLSNFLLLILFFSFNFDFIVPRSVILIDLILLILVMGGSRFIYRILKENYIHRVLNSDLQPVIVIGAGATAINLLKELSQTKKWHVLFLLDDDKSLHNREILGVKVFGGIDKLPVLSNKYNLKYIILAAPSLNMQYRRDIIKIANSLGIEILTVPKIEDFINGHLKISQVRPFDVEDLLGRDSVNLDNSGLKDFISNQAVLVTGAGGSIGSELCRQILKFEPSHLICFDLSEYSLYLLEQEFSKNNLQTKVIFLVGDVRNQNSFQKPFFIYRPKLVFHAAAYKHVPLMEVNNVAEVLNNNVLGTNVVSKVCKKMKVEKLILISTDKAVNPTNVMGATKRLAEMVCHGLQEENGTKFIIVRFGNVLGSSGSVIPKFRQQIELGGPITVTHPDITRYFMSISEAAQLVIQASLMGKGGEVFVLDMGDPVRIADLAKDMIKLSGFSEDDIKIEFTGLRPGEKLFEELLADDENTLPTPHTKLRIASARIMDLEWINKLIKWILSSSNKDESQIKLELKEWVREYIVDNDK